jgi:tetratricopeptide (TPR) repeat protein
MSDQDAATLRALADRIDPDDAGAHNNLGVVLYQKGLLDDAFLAFERALELDPRLEVARRNAEIAFLESGLFDRRVRELQARLRLKPTDHEARDALARVLLLGGDPDGASREWTTLLERHPGSTPLHMKLAEAEAERGRRPEAIRLLQIAARLSPELAVVRIQLAELLLAAGEPARAEVEARRALAIDDSSAAGHVLLGTVLQKLDRVDEATEMLERAREIDPKALEREGHLSVERYRAAHVARTQQQGVVSSAARSGLDRVARARVLRRAGEPKGAMTELEAAIEGGQDTAEIRQTLAEIQLLHGAAESAAGGYERLLAEIDDSAKLWSDRGVALHRLGRVRDAVDAYRRASDLDDGYRLAWNNLGVAIAQTPKSGPAEWALRRATAGEPPVESLWNLGLFYALGGRPDDAVDAYQAAVELDTTLAESWARLGSALFQARRASAAREALLEALERNPGLADARYHLGFSLSALGDYRGALRETQRALEQAPVLPAPSYLLLVDTEFGMASVPAPDVEVGPADPDADGVAFEFDPSALDEVFETLERAGPAPISVPDIEAEMERARVALRRGQLSKAADLVAPVVARLPNMPAPRLLEGEILLERGYAGEALERFDAVLSTATVARTTTRTATELRAEALLVLERPDEAVNAARSAEAVDGPASLLGRALLAAGNPGEAVTVFERALKLGESGSRWVTAYGQALLALDRLDDAERVFRLVLGREPSAVAQVGLARSLEARGDTAGARAAYREAVDILPSYPPAVFGLADLEWEAGRRDAAIRILVDLLSLDPGHVESLVRLGVWLAQLGRWDASRRALQRALTLAPDDPDAQRQLSELPEQPERPERPEREG